MSLRLTSKQTAVGQDALIVVYQTRDGKPLNVESCEHFPSFVGPAFLVPKNILEDKVKEILDLPEVLSVRVLQDFN